MYSSANFSITQRLTGIATNPRLIDPQIAIALGNNTIAAMWLQQLDYWIQQELGIIYRGKRWIWNTISQWQDNSNFPWLSVKQIRNAIDHLRKLEVVESEFLQAERVGHNCDSWNRTLYYTINYKKLEILIKQHLPHKAKGIAPEEKLVCPPRQTNTKNTDIENKQKQTHSETREKNSFTKKSDVEYQTKKERHQSNLECQSIQQNESVNTYSQEKEKIPPSVVLKKQKKLHKSSGPWNSSSQLKAFYRDLVAALPRLGARCSEAVAAKIVQDIKNGLPCTYWDDWKEGVAIGTSSMQEWEITPGVVAPKFIEYIKEKIRGPHDVPEKALERVANLLKDKSIVELYWREFKRIVEALRQDNEKAVAEGRQPYIPVWFIDRADVTLERAAQSANYLNKVNPTLDWVDEGIKGKTPARLSRPSDFDFALCAAVRELQEAAKHGYVSSAKRYIKTASNMAKTEQDKARLRRAIEDIYPELLTEE